MRPLSVCPVRADTARAARYEPLERRVLMASSQAWSGSDDLQLAYAAEPAYGPAAVSLLVTAGPGPEAVTVDWGYGTPAGPLALQPLGDDLAAATALHTFPDGGDYAVTVRPAGGDAATLPVGVTGGAAGADTTAVAATDLTAESQTVSAPGAATDFDAATTGDGSDSGGFATAAALSGDAPPAVAGVYVDSTLWTQPFRDHLAATGEGSATLGYAIPGGTGQPLALPWNNANRLHVGFTEPVTVDQADLILRGVTVATPATGSFTYDSAARTTTWTTPDADANGHGDPLALNRNLIELEADGAGAVADSAGQPLDGEWRNDGTGTFASGDGFAGGDLRFRFNVLPGDATGDGLVNLADFGVVRANFGATAACGPRQGDFTGDGKVDLADFGVNRAFFGQSLPLVPAVAAPSGLAARAAGPNQIDLTWIDNAANEVAYEVERSADSGGTFRRIVTLPAGATGYADAGLLSGATYRYRVRAMGVAADSPYSGIADENTPPLAPAPLVAPTGLDQSGDAWADGVTITWADNATNEHFYQVEWSDGVSGWYVIDKLPAGSTSYTDEYPRIATSNRYRVTAGRDGEGAVVVSPPSNPIAVTPKAPAVAWYDNNAGPNARGTLSPFSTVHGRAVTVAVLPNDADYDHGSYRVSGFTPPAHGTVTLEDAAAGRFTYTPHAGFVGTDTFTYTINDGTIDSRPATAAVDVTNAAPQAAAGRVDISDPTPFSMWDFSDDPITGTVSAADADADAMTYRVVGQPAHGSVTLDPATGAFTYRRASGFAGADVFQFAASDGIAEGPPAMFVIADHQRVAPVNLEAERVLPHMAPILFTGSQAHQVQILQGPGRGGTSRVDYPSTYTLFYQYDDTSRPGLDFLEYRVRHGNLATTPIEAWIQCGTDGNTKLPLTGPLTYFAVSGTQTTELTSAQTRFFEFGADCSIAPGQSPAHGQLTLVNGGFRYVPTPDPQTREPYLGWDFFSYVMTSPDGVSTEQWVQLDVGAAGYVAPTAGRPEVQWPAMALPPGSDWQPQESPPSYDDMRRGYAAGKEALGALVNKLADLGRAVGAVDTAEADDPTNPDAVLSKLDAASAHINPAAALYNGYLDLVNRLNTAAGAFMADQWYVSQDDYDVVSAIQKLPTNVGSLAPSKAQMEQLAASVAELGRGADVYIDTATKIVNYAEDTKKVLDAVQLAGGVTVLATTGARLLVAEGIKACAKAAAKELMEEVASAVAAEVAGHAARLVGLSEEQQQWLQIGLDSYQIFAFMKAANARRRMDDGTCFDAGTQVITGISADGSLLTKSIEDVREGDLVLSRDQHDPADDLEPRRVVNAFSKTADHLRLLSLRDEDGNIQTIRTTDDHPFWVRSEGWITASELSIGDLLSEPDRGVLTLVESVREAAAGGVTVFNLEVETDHTYFVEADANAGRAVWVHNAGPGCTDPHQWNYKPLYQHTGSVPHTTPAKVLNVAGTGEFPGATDLNELPGAAIQQDMFTPWNVADGSMEAVIANKIPGGRPHEMEHVAREAHRVLQAGGEARIWLLSASIDDIKAAFVAAGFRDVTVKGLTVMGKK